MEFFMSAEIKVVESESLLAALEERLYVGMDVGGTKIRTSLVSESGRIFAHMKRMTPRDCESKVTVEAIRSSIHDLLERFKLPLTRITAIGIAIPGVVEPESGHIVVTPNMNLTGVPLGTMLSEHFGIPVFLANDGNLGTLGESWLGAARSAKSTVGIFVGTGVGSGIVTNDHLWTGAGHAAGEIGHIVVSTPVRSWKARLGALLPTGITLDGGGEDPEKFPVCGCGNRGCLESFASRTAIEHAIQEAVAAGIPSNITEFTNGDISIIKAGALAKALKAQDPLVTAIVHYTAEVLAYACLTVRHLIDPEVILLGGGVMEACHRYILPVIEQIVAMDKLPAAPSRRRIVLSQLGDDAVVLGAVALARARTNHIEDPMEVVQELSVEPEELRWDDEAQTVCVGACPIYSDFCVNMHGIVQERREKGKKVRRSELKVLFHEALTGGVNGDWEQLVLGARDVLNVKLTQKSLDFLRLHGIAVQIYPLKEAVEVLHQMWREGRAPTAIFLN